MSRLISRLPATILAASLLAPAFGVDIYVVEDSGFFGVPGLTNGTIGRFDSADPANVTRVTNIGDLNHAGIDLRPGSGFVDFEVTTNSLRTFTLDGKSSLIDSVGYCDFAVGGLTFSNDGTRAFAIGNAGFLSRLVEVDADTGAFIDLHEFFNISISAIATVPEGTAFPADELWAVINRGSGIPELVRLDLENDTTVSVGSIVGLGYNQAFEVGLDWSSDGTLYAAIGGVTNAGVDVSSRFYTLNPNTARPTLVGVIEGEDTWDVASLVVDDRVAILPGDLNCDGVVSVGDINPFVLALTDPAAYAAQFPECDILAGDCSGDDQVTVGDINCFVDLVTGG